MNRGAPVKNSVCGFALVAALITTVSCVNVELAGAVSTNAVDAPRNSGRLADVNLPSCDRIEYVGKVGTIYVQTDVNGFIQWGIYMHNPAGDAGHWWVDVYVSKDSVSKRNRDRVDHKEQNYPPHASVPASLATSGRVFHIETRHVTTDGRESNSVTNGCVIP